ncbi:uncharacterized protein [Antedon mediterranea]|uniref:uncharacterized protein n=1 Tax=Antedon mediterranea TaxID=105859 RepID=UPI003AF8C29C
MPYTCKVVGCQNRGGKGGQNVSYYRIPVEKQRRKLWIDALKVNDLPIASLARVRVCSQHFISGKASYDPKNPDYVPNVFCGHIKQNTESKTIQKYMPRKRTASSSDNEDDGATSDVELVSVGTDDIEKDNEGTWIEASALEQLVEVAEIDKRTRESEEIEIISNKKMRAGRSSDLNLPESTKSTKPLPKILPKGASADDWTTAAANVNVYLVQLYCCKLCNKFGTMSQPDMITHMKESHPNMWYKAQCSSNLQTKQQSKKKKILKSALNEACNKAKNVTSVPQPVYKSIPKQETTFPTLSFKHGLTIVNKLPNRNVEKTMQVQGDGQTVTTYRLGSSMSKNN